MQTSIEMQFKKYSGNCKLTERMTAMGRCKHDDMPFSR